MHNKAIRIDNPQFRIHGQTLCLIIIGGLYLLSLGELSASSSVDSQEMKRVALSVEDNRPVAKAIDILEDRYGWIMTYEDPRYSYSGDVTDVTMSVRRDLDKYKPGEAPKVLVPKKGTLTFEYNILTDSYLPSDPLMVLQELLTAQAASPNAGRFRVEKIGRIMHVIPTEIRDTEGKLISQESVMDATISLAAGEDTYLQRVKDICVAVEKATKQQILISGINSAFFFQHKDQQQINRQKARDALSNLLETLGNETSWSWQLLYDPGVKWYVLNIGRVRKGRIGQ
jgi:hypothetical protein